MGYFIATSTYMGENNASTWTKHGFCRLQKVAGQRERGFFASEGVDHFFRISFKYKFCDTQILSKDQRPCCYHGFHDIWWEW